MFQFVHDHLNQLVGAMLIVGVIACVIAISTWVSQLLLHRRFRKWKNIHSTADLESVYERTVQEVDVLRKELGDLEQTVTYLQKQLRTKVSTARIIRYNAFAETGSDLSFSVALLDDYRNGVVFSSIYGREESRTYAKPVTDGQSGYPLTEEEISVIEGTQKESARNAPVRV